jgi:Polysaccharide deacetylase
VLLDDLELLIRPASHLQEASELIERYLYCRSLDEIELLMQQLREQLPEPAVTRALERSRGCVVTWDDVRMLSAQATVTFGAHTVRHPFLAELDEDGVVHELTESRDAIEAATGAEVEHFCYPYGDLRSIGKTAPRVAAQLFRSAVTMIRGRCGEHAAPHLLPRIPLYQRDEGTMARIKLALAARSQISAALSAWVVAAV